MKLVQYPHPALRHVTRQLTSLDDSVRTTARQMLDIMYEHKGLGLAANQVVYPYQLFVMNVSAEPQKKEEEHVLINPVIVIRKGTQEGEEGCLSFPQLYQKVRRAKTVEVEYYNLEGSLMKMTASDLAARVLQHETDHLQGILYIDKMGPIAKLASRSMLKGFEREFRQAQEKGEIPPDVDIKKFLDDTNNHGPMM